MTPTDQSGSEQAERAEAMESWTTSPLFPLTAGAVGALAAFALLAAATPASSAAALGLALFAALTALRNWWVAEEERPLLAEELLGVHDAADALRDDAADLRGLLTDLAEVVEESVDARNNATAINWTEINAAIASRTEAVERRLTLGAAERLSDEHGAAQAALTADLSARTQAAETRARKLAKALAIAVQEMKRMGDRLDALETAAPETRPAQIVAAETPVAVADAAPEPAPASESADQPAAETRIEAAAAARLVLERVGGKRLAPAPEPESPSAEAATPPARRATPPVDESAGGAMMQAIMALPDGAPRFMAAFARQQGDAARSSANGRQADDDAELFSRAAAAIEDMAARGRDVGVFCALSLRGLRNDRFLRALLAHLDANPQIARRLVFELNQVEIDKASTQDLAVLQQVRGMGFAFALANVVDWSADIAQLARIGFRYVKLDCGALLQRASAAPGAAERLIASFDRVGLELVVEKIDAEPQLQRIAGAGVRLGQGRALAPPRLIRVGDGDPRPRVAAAAG